jgi:uncharacterized protein YaiI (UPF0178 family)
MITLYIDADACPVKPEAYRVAKRHTRKGTALKVLVVTNSPIRCRAMNSSSASQAAPAWTKRATGSRSGFRAAIIVITADMPLASRCVKAGRKRSRPTN